MTWIQSSDCSTYPTHDHILDGQQLAAFTAICSFHCHVTKIFLLKTLLSISSKKPAHCRKWVHSMNLLNNLGDSLNDCLRKMSEIQISCVVICLMTGTIYSHNSRRLLIIRLCVFFFSYQIITGELGARKAGPNSGITCICVLILL